MSITLNFGYGNLVFVMDKMYSYVGCFYPVKKYCVSCISYRFVGHTFERAYR